VASIPHVITEQHGRKVCDDMDGPTDFFLRNQPFLFVARQILRGGLLNNSVENVQDVSLNNPA
jgi:hypothetical protein